LGEAAHQGHQVVRRVAVLQFFSFLQK